VRHSRAIRCSRRGGLFGRRYAHGLNFRIQPPY
jgi:hypothetical protein